MEDDAVRIVRQRNEALEAQRIAEQNARREEEHSERRRLIPLIEGQITLALQRLKAKDYEGGSLVRRGDGEVVEWRIASGIEQYRAGDTFSDTFLLNSDRTITRKEANRQYHDYAGEVCELRSLLLQELRNIAAGIQELGK